MNSEVDIQPGAGPGNPSQAILQAAFPERLYFPLHDYYGISARPLVQPGARIAPGMRLAEFQDGSVLSSPVGGLCEGLISGPVLHPQLAAAPQLVIRHPELQEREEKSDSELDLQALLAEHCLIGHGGAGFPTRMKLPAGFGRDCRLLLVNAAECDPGLSADAALLHHHGEAVMRSCLALAKAVGTRQILLALKRSRRALLPKVLPDGIQLLLTEDAYPAGHEGQLLSQISKILPLNPKLPPAGEGILSLNVATVHALGEVCRFRCLPATRIVTLATETRQINVRAPIGMRTGALLEAFLPHAPKGRLLAGGLLAGREVSPDAPLLWNCSGIYAAGEKAPEMPCINCGFCATACPEGLLPQQLLLDTRAGRETDALHACIECGLCDEVCPSRIPLAADFAAGKTRFHRQAKKAEFAEACQKRFARREARAAERRRARREKHALSRARRGAKATLAAILAPRTEPE